jgi:hypothetical protein
MNSTLVAIIIIWGVIALAVILLNKVGWFKAVGEFLADDGTKNKTYEEVYGKKDKEKTNADKP